jgi:histone-lysine N-methyltransferase SETMAR
MSTGQMSELLLLYDNTKLHTSVHIKKATTRNFGWTVLPHPPYNPDLTPSHYYLFCPLKQSLQGHHYTNKALHNVTCQWLQTTQSDSYQVGTYTLVQAWKKTVDKDKDYVEK